MPQLTARARPAARPRRGLTLVEMMIVIVVLGIVATTLTRIITRQQRFFRDASETVVVRRELRKGASLLPTDLRAISTAGGDLLEAAPSRFAMRATIGSGIVCDRGTQSVDLVPLDLPNHTLTAWYAAPQVDDTVFVFNEGAEDGARDDSWSKHAVVAAPDLDPSYCSGTPFVAPADAGLPKIRLTLSGTVPADVRIGAAVRITRPVRYSVYQPSGSADWYLAYEEHSAAGWTEPQPIAGPLAAATGPRFTYYDTLGVARTPSTPAELTNVARVDVRLRAAGRTDAMGIRGGAPMVDSLNLRIGIRNFR
ncbi:MAG TPA: type II secretion system protein [Gemmatimonadaceae bacterium]|nr:type II secretion system protein [Gemmatimonadaceae bacterium]